MRYEAKYSKHALQALLRIAGEASGGNGRPVWDMILAILEDPIRPTDLSGRFKYVHTQEHSLFWCSCAEMRVKVEYYIDSADDKLTRFSTIYFRRVDEE